MQKWRHQVAYKQYRKVCWTVIGTVMKELFAADRACIVDLEVRFQERATAALRAFSPPSTQHGSLGIALLQIQVVFLGQRACFVG